jgi:pimeloyl-ACP methyl ester carboxylesterase
MTPSPSDLYVMAGGHRLRVRWFAREAEPGRQAIVLLHQGLGSVSQWRDFPERLARATGSAVVGYDRYGHGGSDPLEGPREPAFLDHEAGVALPDLLAALDIERPVLYGHSDGATIALLHAAAFPERATAVISEAAHVISETESASGFSVTIEAYERGDLRSRLERHHGANTDTMVRGWADFWRRPDMRNWHMLDRLPAIRCPVLVIQGRDDPHGSARQVELIAERSGGPVETFWVEDCGHSPHLEKPDLVAGRAAAFLRRIGTAK